MIRPASTLLHLFLFFGLLLPLRSTSALRLTEQGMRAHLVLSVGTDALLEQEGSFRYTDGNLSDYILSGYIRNAVLTHEPRQNNIRFGFEAGVAAEQQLILARFERISIDQFGSTITIAGARLDRRFVAPKYMRSADHILHGVESYKKHQSFRNKKLDRTFYTAPVAGIELDGISFSGPGISTDATSFRASGYYHFWPSRTWKLKGRLTVATHNGNPDTDSGYQTFSSRHLRTERIGGDRHLLGLYGSMGFMIQFYALKRLSVKNELGIAVHRARMVSPAEVAHGYWIGYKRRFTRRLNWMLAPSFEQVILAAGTKSFFSLQLTREF